LIRRKAASTPQKQPAPKIILFAATIDSLDKSN